MVHQSAHARTAPTNLAQGSKTLLRSRSLPPLPPKKLSAGIPLAPAIGYSQWPSSNLSHSAAASKSFFPNTGPQCRNTIGASTWVLSKAKFEPGTQSCCVQKLPPRKSPSVPNTIGASTLVLSMAKFEPLTQRCCIQKLPPKNLPNKKPADANEPSH